MLFEWGRALQSNPRHWSPELMGESPSIRAVESLRTSFLQDQRVVMRRDLGAGHRRSGRKQEAISVQSVAKRALTPREDALALCRWLQCIAPRGRFLELGTSLGLMSAHVAKLGWDVDTWEGCAQTLDLAREGWRRIECEGDIRSQCGDFRDLVRGLHANDKWEVVYLDGCHEEAATLSLAEQLVPHVQEVLVIDDIAWSRGMHRAWQTLQDDSTWRVSFSWRGRGFLLKAPHMERQRFRLA